LRERGIPATSWISAWRWTMTSWSLRAASQN
jgi:hypothetical protein